MNILNEETITKEQKYAMFDGVNTTSIPFAKKFKNKFIVVTIN